MQDLFAIAALLREISFGILIAGLFYTFGLFALGRLFAAISEHGHVEHDMDHDVDHDIDHDLDHELDHDIGEVDHDIPDDKSGFLDVDHDIPDDKSGFMEMDHDIPDDKSGFMEMDHDIPDDKSGFLEMDHDLPDDKSGILEIDKDLPDDKSGMMETDHDFDLDHDIDVEKSGFFEVERGAPMGVTIGTALVVFGFLGSLIYYEGLAIPLIAKIFIHVAGVAGIVYTVRTVLSRAFVESGFMIEPRHIVGREVEAVSTINDGFGEVRLETEMGLRRFHARPFQKGVVFQKGSDLFIVSADRKFVYVDPRKDVVKWLQKQSKKSSKDT
ncbi:MAG: hypothetical protein ACXAAO_09575 [Candidatus Thorarchaeota archaeon]|jgi:hypothetical protein